VEPILATRLACTTARYNEIYAPWLQRAGELLAWASWNPWQSLLDLAGGTGAVAAIATRSGGRQVYLLDLQPRTTDPDVHSLQGDINRGALLTHPQLRGRQFDLIVCRQALGYLDLAMLAYTLPARLTPGTGRFVCNTFVQRPRWRARTYRYRQHAFTELTARLGAQVLHVQISRHGLDVSRFRWHAPTDIQLILGTTLGLHRTAWRPREDETARTLWMEWRRPR
jgi:ubiquinone/menaquinone biosynthesis C-methylase UbiE